MVTRCGPNLGLALGQSALRWPSARTSGCRGKTAAAKISLGWTSGALPENVNYAVKIIFLLGFLESVPDVANKLNDPVSAERTFDEVVKSAQDAAALVLVY